MAEFDDLYAQKFERVSDFVFDEKVAAVFTDMIERSAPGYRALISMLTVIAQRYYVPGTNCYDLGCSLGASGIAVASSLSSAESCRLVAVDNSPAMLEKCRQNWARSGLPVKLELLCRDIAEVQVENASLILLNYTLQFIEPSRRDALIAGLVSGLVKGGVLVLSEKVLFEDTANNELMIDLHHTFKRANGYSELEISQKRSALEKVLRPESIPVHLARLEAAGFAFSTVWFQCFNFVSFLAVK